MLKPAKPREDPIESSVGSLDDARRRRQVDELFRTHGDFLRRLAARLCRSAIDPEDLLQDVFERAVLHVHTLVPDMDHRAWLARVMRNLFIDQLRRRTAAPQHAVLDDEAPAPGVDARQWWEGLDAGDVRERLAELPAELRRAFELFAFDGCSYADIAARLGIPKMTVGTRILRARRRLKQLFLAARGTQAAEPMEPSDD